MTELTANQKVLRDDIVSHVVAWIMLGDHEGKPEDYVAWSVGKVVTASMEGMDND